MPHCRWKLAQNLLSIRRETPDGMAETAMARSSQGSQSRDAFAPQSAFELQSHLALTKTRKGKIQEQEFSGLGVI